MRVFSFTSALIFIPLLMLLWLPMARELGAPGSVYHDWYAPLGLALLGTVLILSVLRLTHRRDGNRTR